MKPVMTFERGFEIKLTLANFLGRSASPFVKRRDRWECDPFSIVEYEGGWKLIITPDRTDEELGTYLTFRDVMLSYIGETIAAVTFDLVRFVLGEEGFPDPFLDANRFSFGHTKMEVVNGHFQVRTVDFLKPCSLWGRHGKGRTENSEDVLEFSSEFFASRAILIDALRQIYAPT